MQGKDTLTALREQIDSIDCALVKLLNERAQVSLSIGKSKIQISDEEKQQQSQEENKKKAQPHVYIPGREKKVFQKVSRLNEGPLSDVSVQAIYREIMSASISLQRSVLVGYLGPPGTFTHQAALERFGDSVEYVPVRSIQEIFGLMAGRQVTYCVVPFENSSNGTVSETLDQMVLHGRDVFQVRAETFLEIEHCLLASSALSFASLERVYSHEQAFGQCRQWLFDNLRHAEQICVKSTGEAVEKTLNDPKSAAIASMKFAHLEGDNLHVLAKAIQDSKEGTRKNVTRFLVLADASDDTPTGDDKSLISFTIDNRSGSLCRALAVFQEGFNISMISTRPTRSNPWEYTFFVEMEGHMKDPSVAEAFTRLKAITTSFVTYGSYPRNKPPQ